MGEEKQKLGGMPSRAECASPLRTVPLRARWVDIHRAFMYSKICAKAIRHAHGDCRHLAYNSAESQLNHDGFNIRQTATGDAWAAAGSARQVLSSDVVKCCLGVIYRAVGYSNGGQVVGSPPMGP